MALVGGPGVGAVLRPSWRRDRGGGRGRGRGGAAAALAGDAVAEALGGHGGSVGVGFDRGEAELKDIGQELMHGSLRAE